MRSFRCISSYPAVFLLDLLDWEGMNRKQYLIKNSWKFLILGLIAAYSLYDSQSILKVVIINFAVFGVIFLLKIARNTKSLWLRVLGAVFCLAGFIILVIKSRIISRFVYNGQIAAVPTWTYWDLLISSKIQHWFSLLPELGYLLLLIVTFFAIRAIFQKGRKREEMISFSFLIFLGLLLFLTFFLVTRRIPARDSIWGFTGILVCTDYLFRNICYSSNFDITIEKVQSCPNWRRNPGRIIEFKCKLNLPGS